MIIQGDCIQEMKKLKENSVDAIVTDPPYGIGFMGKEWDNFKPSTIKEGMEKDKRPKTQIASTRVSNIAGTYDNSISGARKYQEFCECWSKEAIRILKPGGFMLVSCSTRMYHRMTCGIEDAGFEIRDTIMWLYGSGFPKSLNIGKQIDKMKGKWEDAPIKEIKKDGISPTGFSPKKGWHQHSMQQEYEIKELVDDKAKEWEGWGTALKPACEPIVIARKPLSEKNVALNVLKWGTGGINIDDCRIGYKDENEKKSLYRTPKDYSQFDTKKGWNNNNLKYNYNVSNLGRFPANIILDEEAGKMLDEQSGERESGKSNNNAKVGISGNVTPMRSGILIRRFAKGGASRFFYCAKASKSERNFGCEELESKRGGSMDANTTETMQLGGASLKGKSKEIQPTKNNHRNV